MIGLPVSHEISLSTAAFAFGEISWDLSTRLYSVDV